ncbi:MAG: rRNA adenine methyltransferase [Chitinophagales bacterium]
MESDAEMRPDEARKLFLKAWNEVKDYFEEITAAHNLARHRESVEDKLIWDKMAVDFALGIKEEGMRASYPPLYLSIAKCYEDLNDPNQARMNYQIAYSHMENLPINGYGQMIS